MTPEIQNSLHALGMAAKKAMMPGEIAAHIEAITNGIAALQTKADVRGVLSALTVPPPGSGIKDLSGNTATNQVELKGPLAPAIEELAKLLARESRWAMEVYALTYFSGNRDVAEVIAEYGKTAASGSDKLTKIAESKKK